MNGLAKLLGVDPEEYNHWQLHWLPDDPVVVLTVLAIVIPLALWFFWTSLNRVGPGQENFFSLHSGWVRSPCCCWCC